jgi:hypothetical protein
MQLCKPRCVSRWPGHHVLRTRRADQSVSHLIFLRVRALFCRHMHMSSAFLCILACAGLPSMIKALRAAAPPRMRPDAAVPRDGHSLFRTHRVPKPRWVP